MHSLWGVSVGPELCSGRDGRPLPGGHGVSGTVLEGGTLTSSAGTMVLLLVRLFLSERGTWWGVGSVVGTLLGPEGTGRPVGGTRCGSGVRLCPGLLDLRPSHGCVGWWGCGGGRGLVVENCTVDASIFDSLVSLPASVVAGFAWWRWGVGVG